MRPHAAPAARPGIPQTARPASPFGRCARGVAPAVGFRPTEPAPMSKLRVLTEFWQFLRVRKKFWLAPIVLVLVLLGMLVVAVSGSPLAPFVYALF